MAISSCNVMLVALVLVAVRFAFGIFATKKPRTSNPAEQINKNENSSKDAINMFDLCMFFGEIQRRAMEIYCKKNALDSRESKKIKISLIARFAKASQCNPRNFKIIKNIF